MLEFGKVQHAANPWAVFNPWGTQGIQPSSESSGLHDYDDAAAAAVNPWAVFNPWDTQETQSTSESSGESSRFHVNAAAGATMNPWAVFNPWDTQENQSTMEINTLTQNQIKIDADTALQCQGNLGPRRALNLLRDTIGKL